MSGRAPCANGFQTVPELETLTCKDENVSAFSLPSEVIMFEPSPSLVVAPFDNGDCERKIHCNIKLQVAEQEKLMALQREANAQSLKFFPSVTAMATRFLSHSRMDVKKALKSMQATQEWRQNYFKDGPIDDVSLLEDLGHGIVYFSGRDVELRPTLVVRGTRIPAQWYKEKRVDRLIRLLVFCMEYMTRYMLVPGRVENLSVIVDLKGLGLSQVSVSALSDVYKVMSHHYSGRVFRFYVANMPTCLSMIAGMAKSLLTDRQRQKLVVLRDVQELRKHFALHQLEEDLGGSRPALTQFYPFPLQAGPFEAGWAGGPDATAVPGVHLALTAGAAIGRLWDPDKTEEDNLCIEFNPDAEPILERCGLSVRAIRSSPAASSSAAVSPKEGQDAKDGALPRKISFDRFCILKSAPCASKETSACLTPEVSTEGGSSVGAEANELLGKDGWDAFDAVTEIEVSDASVPGGFACLACWRAPSKTTTRPTTCLSL
mmetsp:Transcript_21082/g.72545  ORF Transcript_21082/g.72545 Transcript_21082/m.72545 type:complete len:488 (-) Transcript_21082:475-1938(-)